MKIIEKYFPEISVTQHGQLEKMLSLYVYWNAQINVISRKDLNDFYERHVLHSLSIAKFITFLPKSTILDIGTGGGFPGIPLAILFPEVEFHLVDSIGKKIKVVQEVAKSLGLKNLTSEHTRAENVQKKYDFIVSRAVTQMPEFLRWTKNKISATQKNTLQNGILYLKGGDLSEELKNIPHKIFLLSDVFEEDFFETKKLVYVKI